MTDRERWIIYPLLFLALGVALRDKFTRSINQVHSISGHQIDLDLLNGVVRGRELEVDVIRCRTLTIIDQNQRPLIVAGRETFLENGKKIDAGMIRTRASDGRTLAQFGPLIQCRQMDIIADDGRSRVVSLSSTHATGENAPRQPGGRITLSGRAGRPVVILGTDESGASGVVRTQTVGEKSQASLRSSQAGGLVTLFDGEAKMTLVLGHLEGESGLVAADALGKLVPWLPILQRSPPEPVEKPSPQQQPDQPAETSEPAGGENAGGEPKSD